MELHSAGIASVRKLVLINKNNKQAYKQLVTSSQYGHQLLKSTLNNQTTMKKIIIICCLFWGMSALRSQVAIGKQSITNTSVSLEFANTENRGLILPYITDKTSIATPGAVIYDTTDHKVKYLKDTNTWFDFSIDTTGAADISIQGSDKTEQSTAKTAIGTNGTTDTTPGILVLTDTDKAMILPNVASPHLNIINPAPGMMVYDTTKKQLAVYNGTVWSFWKP